MCIYTRTATELFAFRGGRGTNTGEMGEQAVEAQLRLTGDTSSALISLSLKHNEGGY